MKLAALDSIRLEGPAAEAYVTVSLYFIFCAMTDAAPSTT
jgi:hypothetical protein